MPKRLLADRFFYKIRCCHQLQEGMGIHVAEYNGGTVVITQDF
jgi:hypothetical protein